MYIDTHCHLTFPEFHPDRPMVIGNAKKAGVKKFIVPGVDPLSSRQSVELAKKHPGVTFASVGFHPYEAQRSQGIGVLESLLRQWNNKTMKQSLIVAIGECGLDYHQYKGEKAAGKKSAQKSLFEEHLRLALRFGLPVIVHCRDGTSYDPAAFDGGGTSYDPAAFDGGAFGDLFSVLDGLPDMPRGVLHCFSGGLQELRMARERNLFIGIDGNVTYAKQLEAIVPHIPLESLLLETDSPYLTPIPHRGQRNEPKYLPLVAKKIAELMGKTVKDIEEKTTGNAKSLFQLSS